MPLAENNGKLLRVLIKKPWEFSTAILNGHKYQTITNGKVEWLAQNLNEVLPGMTLANKDTYDVYSSGSKQCYRIGGILTDYPRESLDVMVGTCYRAECRAIIANKFAADGWRIPSRADWNKLINDLDSPYDLCLPSTPCDYNQYDGTNKTGMSIVQVGTMGGSSDDNYAVKFGDGTHFMVNENANGRGDQYMVYIGFHNAKYNGYGNYSYYQSVWYETYYCRLIRNVV